MSDLAIARYALDDGRVVRVEQQNILGEGNEGVVLLHPHDPDRCVKLFHPPEADDRVARDLAAYRARKVGHICAQTLSLPPRFTLPISPVFNERGRTVVGFQMRRIPSSHFSVLKLTDSEFRTDHQIGLRLIMRLFADAFEDLEAIHDEGLVIGDVNLGCLMFQPGANSRAWVDCDSWSYPGYPCLATTETYAHPDLYPNLRPGLPPVLFQPHHDRFSFVVMLVLMAIPGAHPFRMGVHPTIQGIQNRTVAGITIFDSDVKVPRALGSFDVLSDELLSAILDRLKRRTDAALDSTMLRTFADEVIVCSQCRTEYHGLRRHCPKCQEVTTVQLPGMADYLIEELIRAPGMLLFAQYVEDVLYMVCRTGNTVQVVRLDDRGNTSVLSPSLPNIPGARYRFFQDCMVVCPDPTTSVPVTLQVYRIEGNTLMHLEDTSTGILQGESAVFGTTSRFLYRTAGNALMRTDVRGMRGMLTDKHVGEVYQRQSWFTTDRTTGADRELVFGYHRAFRKWEWFLIHGDVAGERYRHYPIGDLGIELNETIEDFEVHFSKSSVLLIVQISRAGREYVRYFVIALNGSVQINELVDPNDTGYEYWANLRGKLHQGPSVLHVTDDGVVKQQYSDNRYLTLTGTAGMVAREDRLVRLGNRVGVVRRGGVSTLSKK